MNVAALLRELQAAGVRLTLAGLDLRYRTKSGVSIAPFSDRMQEHKPALVAVLAKGQPVPATQPPAGWNGTVCAGCRWERFCRVLGPRSSKMTDGPCPAWPVDDGGTDR